MLNGDSVDGRNVWEDPAPAARLFLNPPTPLIGVPLPPRLTLSVESWVARSVSWEGCVVVCVVTLPSLPVSDAVWRCRSGTDEGQGTCVGLA